MNNYYSNLDLDDIKELVARYATFSLSKQAIMEERINYNPLYIRQINTYVKEALDYLNSGKSFNLDGVDDINAELDKAEHIDFLSIYELNKVYLHNIAVRRIRLLLRDDVIDSLNDFIDPLFYDDNFINSYEKTINNNLEVRPDASKLLMELTSKINSKRAEISKTATSFMNNNEDSIQEKVVYLRNDRYSLLVKQSYKNRFNGIIHGESASKSAVYLEPRELVLLNNELAQLEADKESEIARLLLMLTYQVNAKVENYRYNIDSLIKLDSIIAKAEYGFSIKGVIPTFNNEHHFEMIGVGHPLIDRQNLVLNDYKSHDYQGIVISGSNTGGKTIALKTIAITCINAYLGIPIIADKVDLPFYSGIFAIIDENQSIKDSLSTYSAALHSINELLNAVNKDSLVLIDEIGNGTDPKEGEALALAIVEKLLDIKCHFVLTTHFNQVKDLAYNDDRILLSSVLFDSEKMLPTYRYVENNYGYSNSLEIAKYYLNDVSIIERAYEIMNDSKTRRELDMEKLASEIESYRLKVEEAENEKKELEEKRKEYEESLNKLNLEKTAILNEYKEKLNQQLSESRNRLKSIISEFQSKQISQQSAQQMLEESADETYDMISEKQDINVGDYVTYLSGKSVGKVIDRKGDRIRAEFNGQIISGSIEYFVKSGMVETKKKKKHQERVFKQRPKDLNVIGLNSEEALQMVSIYIDDLLSAGVKSGHIIHGYGKGILRTKIHEYLKNNKFIKEFELSKGAGGGGATDITLK